MTEIITRTEVNCTTGEVKEIPLTAEELAQQQAIMAAANDARIMREAEETAKAEAKASAITKLTALGLSDAEIAALTA